MLTLRQRRAEYAAMNHNLQPAPADKKLTYGRGEFDVCYPSRRGFLGAAGMLAGGLALGTEAPPKKFRT